MRAWCGSSHGEFRATYINITDGNTTSHFCGIEFDFGIRTGKSKVVREGIDEGVGRRILWSCVGVELRFATKKKELWYFQENI